VPDLPSLAERYRAVLRDFVASRSEAALETAYELGREAIAAGWGVLDLVRIHQDAQVELLASPPRAEGRTDALETTRAACAVLAESLSPFEMTHRGFREAYATLRHSEARYRSLVDNAPYGICRCGPDGRFTNANPALVRMLGFDSEAELLGVDPATGIHRSTGAMAYRHLLAAWLRPGERHHATEAQWSRRDGTVIQVRLTARAVMGNHGAVEGAELIVEDVTGQRELEERLLLVQKMEAVGQLAGGIAHDFNNFITGITLCNHILARDIPADDPRRRQVEEIDLAATRASLLTQRLLAFARRQVAQPRVLDLNVVITGMTKLLRPLLGADVHLAMSLGREPCPVHADAVQLEQVIMNLAVNARDAMPGGGTVSIETRRIEAGHAAPDLAAGPWAVLAVTDTGVGMDPATQARVFDPFFTTKEPGHGTGLGLSTVYGIVTQSSGHVRVQSTPGHGSTFTVYLPLVPLGRVSPVGLSAVAAQPGRATGTVLLAEDDEIVSHGIKQALEDVGYTVLAAGSGEEALAAARAHAGPISLLVTDLVMPVMGGRALAEHFLATHPEGRVLYISGYAGDAMVRRGLSVPETQFLQKPFSADTLVLKVAEVLGGGSTAPAPSG
jgi:PAS domain S-box-containing protein